MDVDFMGGRVRVYRSSFESDARRIAEAYEELVGKEVTFEKDY